MVSRIGILTGGGDCPGLNAAIRAIVRRAYQANIGTYGFENGWQGVLEPVRLADATRERKGVPPELYRIAEVFFG